MARYFYLWIVALIFFTGCAGGGHPPGAVLPMPAVGMNLGIIDLINRPDASQRVATYLDEIEAAGYVPEVRFPIDRY